MHSKKLPRLVNRSWKVWTRVTKSFATYCKHLSSDMHASKNLRPKELNALTVLLRCWGKRVKGKIFEGKLNDKSCTEKDLVVRSANYAWLQSSWAKSFFPAKCALASAIKVMGKFCESQSCRIIWFTQIISIKRCIAPDGLLCANKGLEYFEYGKVVTKP